MAYQSKYNGQEIDNKLDEINNKVSKTGDTIAGTLTASSIIIKEDNNVSPQIKIQGSGDCYGLFRYQTEQGRFYFRNYNANGYSDNYIFEATNTDAQEDKWYDIITMKNLLDKVYPVGSIYLAYNHTSPASLFGGTWTRISQRFLWGSSSDGTIGATGGAQTHTHTSAAHTHTVAGHTHTTTGHTLTETEIPSHRHSHPNNGHTFSWGDTKSTLWLNAGEMVAKSATNNGLTSYQGPNNYTNYTGGGGSHSHGNTGSTSLTTNSTTPGNTGSSNNMPPYIQVSMWRRTA